MTYETSDITLAAYLKTKGFSIEKITTIGKRGTFHFADVDPSFVSEYMLGNALVEPNLFHATIRQLTQACKT